MEKRHFDHFLNTLVFLKKIPGWVAVCANPSGVVKYNHTLQEITIDGKKTNPEKVMGMDADAFAFIKNNHEQFVRFPHFHKFMIGWANGVGEAHLGGRPITAHDDDSITVRGHEGVEVRIPLQDVKWDTLGKGKHGAKIWETLEMLP